MLRAPLLTVVILGAAIVAADVARVSLRVGDGLSATYFTNSDWSGTPAFTGVDAELSPAAMAARFGGTPPDEFSVRWQGYLTVPSTGTYTLATTSDDGSAVFISGQSTPIVDNGGRHGAETQSGTLSLTKGPHNLEIRYMQAGGESAFQLLWSSEHGPLRPVPLWALSTRWPKYSRVMTVRVLDAVRPFLVVVAFVASLWLIVAWWRSGGGIARVTAVVWRRVAPVVGIAAALVVTEYGTRFAFERAAASGRVEKAAVRNGDPRISLNSLRFRDPEIRPKDPARFRIAVIGDSYTFGEGLEERERFSNVLAESLGPGYEVLNLGKRGHHLPEHLSEFDEVLATMKPDFVLLQLCVNNFETPKMRRPIPYPLLPEALDTWMQSWMVYGLLSDRWVQLQEAIGLSDNYVSYMARHLRDPNSPDAREAFGKLREFFDHAHAAGVPAGAVLFPAADAMGPFGTSYPFGYLHDHVHSVCVEASVHCLDLLGMFSAIPDPQSTWINPLDAHPNALTNRNAATEILREFGSAWPH